MTGWHAPQPMMRFCDLTSVDGHASTAACRSADHLCVPLDSSTTFVRRVFIDSS